MRKVLVLLLVLVSVAVVPAVSLARDGWYYNDEYPYYTAEPAYVPVFPVASYAVTLRYPVPERIQPQCGPGYGYKTFASVNGGTKLYKPQDITYLCAHFCVGDWVYIEFGYTDGVLRYGFFEKSLFDPSVSWWYIPEYSLDCERYGTVLSETTPRNGPGWNSGSYSSCKLYAGTTVCACMEYNGWYLCRFYNDHTNHYGDVYLWVPGSDVCWY